MSRSKGVKTQSPNYAHVVDFHDDKEVGILLDKINRDVLSKEELRSMASTLIYRIAFYTRNRTISDSDNITRC